MSFEKAIKSGKEHRKPFRGGKRYSKSCSNHGGCPYCQSNRHHKNLKRLMASKAKEDRGE